MGLRRRGSQPRASVSRLRRALGVVSWVLALALAAGWLIFLRPAGLGGPAGYVIVSGESMEPLLHTGDLAIVTRQDEYSAGDVVAYRIPAGDVGGGMLVIHRVIDGSAEEGLVLQGDNRDTPDMWRPRTQDVVGTLQLYIPHAGTALFLLRTPLVIAGVAGFLGFWVVAFSPDRKRTDSDEVVLDEVDVPDVVPPVAVHSRPVAVATSPTRGPAQVATVAVVGLSIGTFFWTIRNR